MTYHFSREVLVRSPWRPTGWPLAVHYLLRKKRKSNGTSNAEANRLSMSALHVKAPDVSEISRLACKAISFVNSLSPPPGSSFRVLEAWQRPTAIVSVSPPAALRVGYPVVVITWVHYQLGTLLNSTRDEKVEKTDRGDSREQF